MEKYKHDKLYGDEKALPAYEIVKRELLDSFYNCNAYLRAMKFQNPKGAGRNLFYDFCSEVAHLFMLLRDDIIEYIASKEKDNDKEDKEKISYLLKLDSAIESPNFLMKNVAQINEEDYKTFIHYFRLLSKMLHYLNIKNIKIKTIAPEFSVLEGTGLLGNI